MPEMREGPIAAPAGLSALRISWKHYIIVPAILLTSAAIGKAADDPAPLIAKGEYEDAYYAILETIDSLELDEQSLYQLCLTAPTGREISDFLKKYSQEYPDGANADFVRQKLCDYYGAQGMDITASKVYPDIADATPENSGELLRIAMSRQRAGEFDAARAIFLSILRTGDSALEDWALLGIADCELLSGNCGKAKNYYEEVMNRGERTSVFPLALLGLSECYHRDGQDENAQAYYRRYRSEFPGSPAIPELESSGEKAPAIESPRAMPKSINAEYFIQVGVFSKKENAKTCLRKYRSLGYHARMEDFSESGLQYHRVMLGPFKNEAAARQAKDKLERSESEKFLILIQ
jgi:tetratricopeptide (TPR) repeat protein